MIYWRRQWKVVRRQKFSGSCMQKRNGYRETCLGREKFWREHLPKIRTTRISGLLRLRLRRKMAKQRQHESFLNEHDKKPGLSVCGKRVSYWNENSGKIQKLSNLSI